MWLGCEKAAAAAQGPATCRGEKGLRDHVPQPLPPSPACSPVPGGGRLGATAPPARSVLGARPASCRVGPLPEQPCSLCERRKPGGGGKGSPASRGRPGRRQRARTSEGGRALPRAWVSSVWFSRRPSMLTAMTPKFVTL